MDAQSPTNWLERLRGALGGTSEASLTNRLAGTVFVIRVFSAGLAYLSQILLARWMNGSEYGVFVYVWTWVVLIGSLLDAITSNWWVFLVGRALQAFTVAMTVITYGLVRDLLPRRHIPVGLGVVASGVGSRRYSAPSSPGCLSTTSTGARCSGFSPSTSWSRWSSWPS